VTNYATVFERAADRIERYGLNKHAYYKGWDPNVHSWSPKAVGEEIRRDNRRCCTLGAIYAESTEEFATAATRFARHTGLEDDHDIPTWNDRPSQRRGRVVRALREAAAKERQPSE